jgi:hypothetical protein
LLLLPTLITTVMLFRAKNKRDFTWASAMVKLVMFAGLFLLLRSWPQNPSEIIDQAQQYVGTRF